MWEISKSFSWENSWEKNFSDWEKNSNSWENFSDWEKNFWELNKNNLREKLKEKEKEIKKKFPSKNNSTIQKDVEELLPDDLYNHLVYLEDLDYFKWLKDEKDILWEVKSLFSDSEYSGEEMWRLLFDAWIFNKNWFKPWLINDDP